MPSTPVACTTIDQYISQFPPKTRQILRKIRRIIRTAAPDAQEIISYRMPAFRRRRILLYFAAFKNHIGLFPPIKTGAALKRALEPYTGPKGNLRFPCDKPMPYTLIEGLARLRARQEPAACPKKRRPGAPQSRGVARGPAGR
jgi:uncharacterized protein YdhG (YjbR/CyaY superfamily)